MVVFVLAECSPKVLQGTPRLVAKANCLFPHSTELAAGVAPTLSYMGRERATSPAPLRGPSVTTRSVCPLRLTLAAEV